MDQQVIDNQQAHRFEIYHGDELAGFAEYHLYGNRLALLHTEIDARFQGRGLGGKLVHHVLDDARHRGLVVLPYCRFTRHWITKHPDYLDLVPEIHRAHFDL
ncbi:MAG: GNAT family N-acetyltransferase [Pseudonocardiaceae bacterium]